MNFSLLVLIFLAAAFVYCRDLYQLLLYVFVTLMGGIIGALHHGDISSSGCLLLYNHVKEYFRDIKLKRDRIYSVEFYDHDGYLCFDLKEKRIVTNMKMQPLGIENGIKIGFRFFDYSTAENIDDINLEESGI